MAAHLTQKENYLRMMAGEVPEFVPRTMAFNCGVGPAEFALGPPPGSGITEFVDLFGIPMIVEPNSGPIPKPGDFKLEDVRNWRDVIKRPKVLRRAYIG